MLALAKRSRNADKEIGGQRPADGKAGDLRLESQGDQVRSQNQEVLGRKART